MRRGNCSRNEHKPETIFHSMVDFTRSRYTQPTLSYGTHQ